jgi:hypothetical protein
MLSKPYFNFDEEEILSSSCKSKTPLKHDYNEGVLYLTNYGRMLFVSKKGIINKRYEKEHEILVKNMINARKENNILGDILVIDFQINNMDISYRYKGINNLDQWTSTITKYIALTKKIDV